MLRIRELRETLILMLSQGKTWREIAHELYPRENQDRICSILWRIANKEYEPKNNHLRERLGLVFLKKVEACPECNEIHLARCPKVEVTELPSMVRMALAPICEKHGVVHLAHGCPRPRKLPQAWMSAEEVEERLDYIRRNYG